MFIYCRADNVDLSWERWLCHCVGLAVMWYTTLRSCWLAHDVYKSSDRPANVSLSLSLCNAPIAIRIRLLLSSPQRQPLLIYRQPLNTTDLRSQWLFTERDFYVLCYQRRRTCRILLSPVGNISALNYIHNVATVREINETSVEFRSWSRSSAFSPQVTETIIPPVGCHYFSPTRGYLPSRRVSPPFGRYHQSILLGTAVRIATKCQPEFVIQLQLDSATLLNFS